MQAYAPDIENLTLLTSSLFVIKERSRWTALPRSRGHSSVGRERAWSLELLSGHGGRCLQPQQKPEVDFRYILNFDAGLCCARPCLREKKIAADKMFKVSMMETLERIVRTIIGEN